MEKVHNLGEGLFAPLDDKLLNHILGWFRMVEIVRVRRVCSRWNRIIMDGVGHTTILTDKTINNLTIVPKVHMDYGDDAISVNNLQTPLSKRLFPNCSAFRRIYFDFGSTHILQTQIEVNIGIVERSRDLFRSPIWVNEKGTINPQNIVWLLQNCKNLGVIIFNTNSLSGFDQSVYSTPKKLSNITFKNIRTLVASISPLDYKPLFNGLLLGDMPNLYKCIFQFHIPPNTLPKDQCQLLYQFITRVRPTLEVLDIKHAPCVSSSTAKTKKKKNRPSKDLLTAAYSQIQFQLKELRLEMRKEMNVEKRLEVEFLRTLCSLSNLTLDGVPLTDIMQAVRMNANTLNYLSVRDLPGHKGKNKPGLFDCSCLSNCVNLLTFVSEDFRIKDIRKLPCTLRLISLLTLYPNEGPGPISNLKDLNWLWEWFPLTDFACCLPALDTRRWRRIGGTKDSPEVIGSFEGKPKERDKAKGHRIAIVERSAFEGLKPHLPRDSYDWILEDVYGPILLEIDRKDNTFKLVDKGIGNEGINNVSSIVIPKPLPFPDFQVEEFRIMTSCPVPVEVINLMLPHLASRDKKNCRLVSKKWNEQAEKCLSFGFWLNDQTYPWVKETKVDMNFLAISKLVKKSLVVTKLDFLKKAHVLILECDERSFQPDPLGRRPNHCLENLFPETEYGTISELNLRLILAATSNAQVLFFNKYALSNVDVKTGASNKNNRCRHTQARCHSSCCLAADFLTEGNFQQLKVLSVIVTGAEIEAFSALLLLKFPKLEKFIVKYNLRRTQNLDQYQTFFIFLYGHRGTLKSLNITSPPIPPDPRNSRKKGKPEKPVPVCVRYAKDVKGLQLQELCLDVTMASGTLWTYGHTLLLAQNQLIKLRMRGFCRGLVTQAIGHCSKTLESIEINPLSSDFTNVVNKDGSVEYMGINLSSSVKHLKTLTICNFHRVFEVDKQTLPAIESMAFSWGSVKVEEFFRVWKKYPTLRKLALLPNEQQESALPLDYHLDLRSRYKDKKINGMDIEEVIGKINKTKVITFMYGNKGELPAGKAKTPRLNLQEEISYHKRSTWYDEFGHGFAPTRHRLCYCDP